MSSTEGPDFYYKKAPMSDRDGETLSQFYGYPDLQGFAADLPEAAAIADIGAGKSPLGRELCRLRDDISWLSIDRRYKHPWNYWGQIIRRPPNLEFMEADSLDLAASVGERRFDLVLSYWMLPHIILDSRELGLVAAQNMLSIAKPTGTVAIGPCVSLRAPIAPTVKNVSEWATAVELQGDSSDLGRLAEEIVTAATLPPDNAEKVRRHQDRTIWERWADAEAASIGLPPSPHEERGPWDSGL